MFSNDGILEGVSNIGEEVFGRRRFGELGLQARGVRTGELLREGNIKDKDEVEIVLGERINLAEYFRLRQICGRIRTIFDLTSVGGKCLDVWIRAKKRGGGILRRAISGRNSPIYLENDPRTVPSALSFWGNDVVTESRTHLELNFGLWGVGQLSAGMKMFLFNMVQGKLYLNNVLANMGNTSNKCTFCEIVGKKEVNF